MLPHKQLLTPEHPAPDLYGPFWLASTVVIILAASSSFADYLAFAPSAEHPYWQYDFERLTVAAGIMYAMVSVVPLIAWFIMSRKDSGFDKTLVETLSVYGYSLLVWLPVSLLCVFPINWARWLLAIFGGAFSSCFLVSNLMPKPIAWPLPQNSVPLWGFAAAVQVLLTFGIKLIFFAY